MKKFKIIFTDGREIEVEALLYSEVTTKAIAQGKMTKLDCYDIKVIKEIK